MTRDQALEHANQHRAQFGDDVIQHESDDYGAFLGCDECGWVCPYTPEPAAGQPASDSPAVS